MEFQVTINLYNVTESGINSLKSKICENLQSVKILNQNVGIYDGYGFIVLECLKIDDLNWIKSELEKEVEIGNFSSFDLFGYQNGKQMFCVESSLSFMGDAI